MTPLFGIRINHWRLFLVAFNLPFKSFKTPCFPTLLMTSYNSIFPLSYCIKDGCESSSQCQNFMLFQCSHQFLTKWIMWRLQSKEELSHRNLNLMSPSLLRPTTFELVEWLLHIAKKTIPWTLVVVKYVWAMPPNHFLWYTLGAQSFFINDILLLEFEKD